MLLVVPSMALWSGQAGANTHAGLITQQTKRLVVTVDGKIGNTQTFGAGIVIGATHDEVYIATANHVVRRQGRVATGLKLRFSDIPGDSITGQVLGEHDANRDIAVIKVTEIRKYGLEDLSFPFRLLARPANLAPGSELYKIGYPFYEAWSLPNSPDRLDGISSRITFQSSFLKKGHSGGALIDSRGNLIGMVLGTTDRLGQGSAVKIDDITRLFGAWKLPVGLTQSPVAVSDSAATAAVPVTAAVDTDWAKFHISDMSYLPPIPDFGSPDYKVIIQSRSGSRTPEVEVGRKIVTSAFSKRDFRHLQVRIIEQDPALFSSGYEEITSLKQLSLDDALLGKRIRLEILNNVFQKYPSIDPERDNISFYLKAVDFDPDENSGPDFDARNATHLLANRLIDDNVDFNKGDATDHIFLPRRCLGAVITRRESNFSLESLDAGRGAVAMIPINGDNQSAPDRIYIIDSRAAAGCILRLQAGGPFGSANYKAYSVKAKPDGEADMVSLIEALTRDKYYSYRSHDREVEELKKPVSALQRNYGIGAESIIPIYHRIITQEPEDKWKALRFVKNVIGDDAPEYHAAARQCCASYRELLQLLAIQQSGSSGAIDRAAVAQGLASKHSGYVIFTIETVGKSPDKALVEQLLTPLLLHETDSVAKSARRVLLDVRRESTQPVD